MNDLLKALEKFKENPTQENERILMALLPDEDEIDSLIKVQNSGIVDHFQRPIWVDELGCLWADVNLNNNNPSLYSISKIGAEPEFPIDMWEEVTDLYTQSTITKIVGA